MKRVLVTTTINVPTVIREWVKSGLDGDNDEVIVVGDKKSPHHEIEDFLNSLDIESFYINPNDHTGFHIEDVTGYNVIQRRNLGFLAAWEHPVKPDIIITIDDDNFPTKDWVDRVTDILVLPNKEVVVTSSSKWFNPGLLCEPPIVHRGYPIDQRHITPEFDVQPANGEKIGVFQSLVIGDPDIDAMERIVRNPKVDYVRESRTIGEGTWMPFNSQATAFRAELIPLMLMWPGVGRYDDIWGSYLTQAVMQAHGYHVQVGLPAVRQERNPHNLLTDLKDEFLGYTQSELVNAAMRGIQDSLTGIITHDPGVQDTRNVIAISAVSAFKTLSRVLENDLPPATIAAFAAWIEDIELVFNK